MISRFLQCVNKWNKIIFDTFWNLWQTELSIFVKKRLRRSMPTHIPGSYPKLSVSSWIMRHLRDATLIFSENWKLLLDGIIQLVYNYSNVSRGARDKFFTLKLKKGLEKIFPIDTLTMGWIETKLNLKMSHWAKINA